ncbi:MAG: PASTA domain-containing protein [Flavobacteriales bacterium]|nr:PASTA domain-containing protein [Flavobacteriales bacterium]
MFKFIFSKSFLINVVIALVFAAFIIWGIFKFIDSYTLHGETISVPPLEGLTITEVKEILSDKKLRYSILDSIYIANAEKGVILEQNPLADDLVKENRTIYITVSKIVPPKVSMPSIAGEMSLRLAIAKLESYGLKVKTKYAPSEYVNSVIRQEINGKEVKPNTKIEKGSTITLTIGSGTSNEKIMVPYLIGLLVEDAENKLMTSSLNIGFKDYEGCNCETKKDSLTAKVYRQSPIRSEQVAINLGSSVDLYFTCDSSMMNINLTDIDSLNKDSLN